MTKLDLDNDKLPPKRDGNGRLLPGRQSINPKGRPKKGQGPNVTFKHKVENLLFEASSLPESKLPEREYSKDFIEPERDANGRFVGANNGRKAAIDGGRVSTPEQARKLIGKRIEGILITMCDLAEAGDVAAAKLVADRFLPALKMVETVTLDAATLPRLTVVSQAVHDNIIDVEPEPDDSDTAGVSDVPRELRDKD